MDEATLTKALQVDLTCHLVKIQVKWVGSRLYILASRDAEDLVNYEFLFSLIQTRLEDLRSPNVESFMLYGKVSGEEEPEWKKAGIVSKHSSQGWQQNLIGNWGDRSKPKISNPRDIREKIAAQDLRSPANRELNPASTQIHRPLKNTESKKKRSPNTARQSSSASLSNFFSSHFFNLIKLTKTKILVIAIVVLGLGLGAERSHQQKLINQAQSLTVTAFNPNQPSKISLLEGDRQKVNETLTNLKKVIVPLFWNSEDQALIPGLEMRLGKIDQKLTTERKALSNLNLAETLANRAVAIARNPPQKVGVWQEAQSKWQEALAMLETIPIGTTAALEAQAKTQIYNQNLQDIERQIQRQIMADAVSFLLKTETGQGIQIEMKDLKSMVSSKPEFMNVCTPFVGFNLDPAVVKAQKVELAKVSMEMCNFLWLKKT